MQLISVTGDQTDYISPGSHSRAKRATNRMKSNARIKCTSLLLNYHLLSLLIIIIIIYPDSLSRSQSCAEVLGAAPTSQGVFPIWLEVREQLYIPDESIYVNVSSAMEVFKHLYDL